MHHLICIASPNHLTRNFVDEFEVDYLSFPQLLLHVLVNLLNPRIANTAADIRLEDGMTRVTGGECKICIWKVLSLNPLHVMVQRGSGEGLAFRLVHLVQIY